MRRPLIGLAALLLACQAPAQAPVRLDFDVVVSLSPKARARLADPPEGIIVAASYYGDPTPEAAAQADEMGQIALASETVPLTAAAGVAHVTGAGVKPEQLRWLAGPVQVNVNVYSARQSNPDNLLACDFFDGPLDHATSAPVELACALIEENVATKAKS